VCVVPSVACVSVKGCRVGRDVGGEVDEGEREKVTASARGGGGVGGDCVREASFPTNLARVGLCGP
jgi:hypothetical protein